jgi:hypothetical protein
MPISPSSYLRERQMHSKTPHENLYNAICARDAHFQFSLGSYDASTLASAWCRIMHCKDKRPLGRIGIIWLEGREKIHDFRHPRTALTYVPSCQYEVLAKQDGYRSIGPTLICGQLRYPGRFGDRFDLIHSDALRSFPFEHHILRTNLIYKTTAITGELS